MATEVAKRLISVDDYYKMAEVGILKPGDRVELINGEIYEMSPVGSKHGAVVKRLARILNAKFSGRAVVGVQDPVVLNQANEPEPDIAILKYRDDDYASGHPTPSDVLAIIEVASSSVDFDRDVKMPLYASAGIPEYWIVDIGSKKVEVYAGPANGEYLRRAKYKPGDIAVLLGDELPVSEILAPIL